MRMPDGNTAALMAYEASEIVITEYDRKIAPRRRQGPNDPRRYRQDL
jgi:hypothetical protein